jgi:cytochrome P450
MATQVSAPVFTPPPHVDPAGVQHCVLFDRVISYDNPFETIIPEIHKGPAVFYADNIMFEQPGWVVRRHADIRRVFADWEHFSPRGMSGFPGLIGEDWVAINELDPPYHSAVRTVVNKFFAPSKMMALEGQVRRRARDLIEKFKDRGECEYLKDFSINFPISIFLDLYGLPQEQMALFYDLEQRLINGSSVEMRRDALLEIRAILLEAMADRRKNPTDDLLSASLHIEVDGKKWTDTQIFGFIFTLYLAGLDTVTSNLGMHIHHLATHAEDQETMRANSYMDNVVAVEELMRAFAVVSISRFVIKETEIDGMKMMPGDAIICSTPLASRDPEAYDDPNTVKLDRRVNHLTLGHSDHRCLGRHLARRELQIAHDEFIKAIPSFKIEPGYKVPFFLSNMMHIEELPLTWS